MKPVKILILALVILAGCKDATRAQFSAQGKPHKVTLYSGGKEVRVWHSTGSPKNEENSDGWYFEDKATHKLVEVTGTVVFEVEE